MASRNTAPFASCNMFGRLKVRFLAPRLLDRTACSFACFQWSQCVMASLCGTCSHHDHRVPSIERLCGTGRLLKRSVCWEYCSNDRVKPHPRADTEWHAHHAARGSTHLTHNRSRDSQANLRPPRKQRNTLRKICAVDQTLTLASRGVRSRLAKPVTSASRAAPVACSLARGPLKSTAHQLRALLLGGKTRHLAPALAHALKPSFRRL